MPCSAAENTAFRSFKDRASKDESMKGDIGARFNKLQNKYFLSSNGLFSRSMHSRRLEQAGISRFAKTLSPESFPNDVNAGKTNDYSPLEHYFGFKQIESGLGMFNSEGSRICDLIKHYLVDLIKAVEEHLSGIINRHGSHNSTGDDLKYLKKIKEIREETAPNEPWPRAFPISESKLDEYINKIESQLGHSAQSAKS